MKFGSNVDGFLHKKNPDLKFLTGMDESREYQIRADDTCYPPLQVKLSSINDFKVLEGEGVNDFVTIIIHPLIKVFYLPFF